MAPKMRRIVTGHDANGKAIVVEDGQPPVVFTREEVPDLAFYEVWNTQSSPAKISAKSDPTKDRPVKVPPPKGGTIIRVIDFPPEDPSKPGGQQYGYGIAQLRWASDTVYFHGGETPGYNSFIGHDPTNQMALVIWTNLPVSLDGHTTANALMAKVLDQIYVDSPLAPSSAPTDPR